MSLYLVGAFSPSVCAQQTKPAPHDSIVSDAGGSPGNEACAPCHADVYRSYVQTAMAQASGLAVQNLIAGDFQHAPSGVHYRVYASQSEAWLSFERIGDPLVRGTRKLLYFIGSGRRGRTYLFSVDGFFFESPINWYAQKRLWDMAPAFQSAQQIPLSLPASPSCLACHTSNMQTPAPGTENKYSLPPFAHAGITCERCHGPATGRALSGSGVINPAKLPPARRDAICMQCHLEGNVAIEQPGKHLYDFQPGTDLSEYVRYYVFADDGTRSLRAVSQSEALASSVCKRKAGDAMSCTSCHDPHSSPSADGAISFYRTKCLACHGAPFGARHHPDKPDCRPCHMPPVTSADVAHTQATDHRILRIPIPAMPPQQPNPLGLRRLVRFPPVKNEEDMRDLALAWESLAEGGMRFAIPEAEARLRKAVLATPGDPAVLTAWGYIEQLHGKRTEARKNYQRALEIDPLSNSAAINLGVIEAQEEHVDRAISLWRQAFERAPAKSAVGLNLARVSCSIGQFDQARTYTLRVLEFNPDLPEAKKLLRELSADRPSCATR
ncbi:MAG TPA: tetratricopeptide repeat protein [Terriglobales bacterium]|nr:tetratricopeptide repeat protein [Terriglobales bacterium]